MQNQNQNNQLSKSKRRRLRLLAKGVTIGEEQQVSQPIVTLPSSRRRRNRRRRVRNSTGTKQNSQDDYLFALMYPEQAVGAKIPDMVTYPSAAFQVESGGTLATGTGGDSMAILIDPIVSDGSTIYPIYAYNGTSSGSLATATPFDWVDGTSLRANFQYVRCVSASLEVFFVGPSTADGGSIVAGCTVLTVPAPTTYNGMYFLPEMTEMPARCGVRVLWKPTDMKSLQYIPTGLTQTQYSNALINLPFLVVAVNGQASATGNYRWHVTVNFEGIPKTDSYTLLSPTDSPYNESSMKKAIEWGSKVGNNISSLIADIGPYVSASVRAYNAISSIGRLGQGTAHSNANVPATVRSPGSLMIRASSKRSSLTTNSNFGILKLDEESKESKDDSRLEHLEDTIQDLLIELDKLKVGLSSSKGPGSPYVPFKRYEDQRGSANLNL